MKQEKEQTMGQKEAHLVPFLPPSEGLTPESIAPTSKTKASLNASLYTAVEGEFGCNREESPTSTNVQHALENKEQEGSKRQEVVSCVNYQNDNNGGGGNRTRVPIPIRISVYVCIRFFIV